MSLLPILKEDLKEYKHNMDVNKNTYTIVFAAIMVIIIAAILSVTSLRLESLQDINIALEKKQNILKSIGVEVSRDSSEEAYSI